MKICFATSECVPYVKTGGLADVSGSLPKALAELGHEVKVFLPLYQSIKTTELGLHFSDDLQEMSVQIGEKVIPFYAWHGTLPGSNVDVHFIECAHYYHRKHVYTEDDDEDERFIFFQHAVFQILQRYHWAPDIIHANDWQCALLPVLLKMKYHWDALFSRTATLLTIHNIGYQGRFSSEAIGKADLFYDQFYPGGPYEFHGSFSFLKTGLLFAEMISTVSPTYAKEIQTKEYGAGLEGVLASRRADMQGILNGIDTDIWSPEVDAYIQHHYAHESIEKKTLNKRDLLESVGLPFHEDVPVIGIISRFTGQKGFDLLRPVMHAALQMPVQFVILGSGETQLEDFFRFAAQSFPEKVWTYIGFNNELSHRVTAGSDIFLMPSLYEPCGLNQMYSLNYGTVPIVRKTGGLADTVMDYHEFEGAGNGFSFHDKSPEALMNAIARAVLLYSQKDEWRTIMLRGMKTDFTWKHSAKQYEMLYEEARRRRG